MRSILKFMNSLHLANGSHRLPAPVNGTVFSKVVVSRARSSDSESSGEMPVSVDTLDSITTDPLKRRKMSILPAALVKMEDAPPTYATATAKEHASANLVGALMLKTSCIFGLSPFKAPYTCDNDVSVRRSSLEEPPTTEGTFCRLRDRICILDLLLCVFNTIVICNNIRLHVFPTIFSEDMNWSLFSPKAAAMIQNVMGAVLPLVCVIGMMLCSLHMHKLLEKLTDIHFRVVHMKCNKKAKAWRMFFYVVMVFFIIGVILQLPMNMFIEFSAAENETEIVNMPLCQIPSHFDKVVVFFDRYYFPIIQFGVVKLPQLIIMMISIRIAAMFQIETKQLRNSIPTKASLVEYFSRLRQIISVLEMLECCFNKLILVIVGTTVTSIIFKSYNSINMLLLQGQGINNAPSPLVVGGWVALFTAFQSFCTVFALILNAGWVVLFIVPCIVCNELSRGALPVITNMYVEDPDAKIVKDQIIQKLNDPTWGLTLGKFMKIDRSFAGTLMSFIFTVVVVWLQLDTSLPIRKT
uniref:G_PROTEIN_RECEP_F1_2 domain-containing protein n=1 Tax=Panagrellus redivivus TaxID=6233 RepID=A0A7E4VRZ1_PANRE